MHQNALQAAMVLNMRGSSETVHLTWKGVYNNRRLQDKH